jgi:hypothetical protein
MKALVKHTLLALSLTPVLLTMQVQAGSIKPSMAPKNASVYIISPVDGATVSETFTVTFGLKNMGVSPAGLEKKHTGHHHLLIDANELPKVNMPMGSEVKHFGGGQTETSLTLTKGQHTLQLILGDHRHIPHNPIVVSEKISITVK